MRIGPTKNLYYVPFGVRRNQPVLACFYVPEYYYVTDNFWNSLKKFTDPELINSSVFAKELLDYVDNNDPSFPSLEVISNLPQARRIKEAIDLNPSRTMTWQFDALDKDFNLIRQCEAFGEPRLVPWSWFRATFTRSFFKIIATILNTFLYFENRKKTKRMEKK